MADVLREPLYVRTYARGFISASVVPNLLLSTLAVVAAAIAPATNDWQNNATRKVAQQVLDPPNLLTSSLSVKALPFNPIDLSVSFQRKFTSAEQFSSRLTTGIPRVPFQQTDWQSPQYLRRILQDIPPNTIPLLTLPIQPPLRPTDLQLSIKSKVVYAEPVQNFLVRGITPPPPFRQAEWQTLKTRMPIPLVNDPPNLPLKTLFVPSLILPFSLKEWPQQYRVKLRADIQWTNSLLPRGIGGIPPYTQATVSVTAFRRGYFGGVVIEPGRSFSITSPFQFTPYWMTLVGSVPDDWNALMEVFDSEIDRAVIRRQTVSDVAAILAQDPGPYRSA